MVEFDLSEIPGYPNINISSATLEVYQSVAGSVPNAVYGVYRLIQSWNESTVTWNNRPAWFPTSSATFTASSGSQWWSFNITNLVQQWADGTDNYGLVIRTGGGCNAAPVVFSSDNGSSSQRPKLTVVYTTSSIEHTTWGSIKAF